MNVTGKKVVLTLLGIALTACASSPSPGADSAQAVTPAKSLRSLSLSSPLNRQLTSSGATSFLATSAGSDALQYPEFPGYDLAEGNVAGSGGTSTTAGLGINRRLPGTKTGKAPGKSNGGQKPKARPVLGVSFDGLNLRDQRTANGGNQFTVEPPDQALCAGNGFVLESVNDVLKVYSTSGQAKTGTIDLNTFYHYPAAFNRTARTFGPSITDPVCAYDMATQRWFHVVLTLDTDPRSGGLTGSNHLDIAVSQTADPTGQWNIYKLAVQDDGTQGTPSHPNCPCLGDYPHIGIDANGVYLTTNEFPFAGGFNGAQIYAISKTALVNSASGVPLVQYDLSNSSIPAFTVWPATSPGQDFETAAGGTEYFLSSLAVFSNDGTSNQLAVWGLANTQSLNTSSPALTLNAQTVNVEPYAVPPLADQKSGDFPLGQCLNTASCSARLLGRPDPFAPEVISPLDGNDSRMQQVTYANGKLWGALDTAVNDNGTDRVGIEWYVLKPKATASSVSASVILQGTLSAPGNSVTRPALAVTESGRGVMGFTLVGRDHFPSAGYTGMDAKIGAGNVEVAAEGLGPQDGFSGYKAFGNPPRPRWGDYAAAASDGKTIWIANEYIAQTCTLSQYTAAPFASCGGTRVTLGNWGTRISAVTP